MATQENDAPVELSLDRDEVPVTLKTKDEPTRECVIREMDGFQRDKYLNKQKGKINKTTQAVEDFEDVQTSLISLCLYDKTTNELIHSDDVRKYPSKTQIELYKICMKVNGLDWNAQEAAKNS